MKAQLRVPDTSADRLAASPALTPFLKWPGGKSQELPTIAAAAPALRGRYIDPFVGGGSVLLAVPDTVEAWANDAVKDLIELYRAAAGERQSFRATVQGVADAWDALRSCVGLYRELADDFLGGTWGVTVVRHEMHAQSLDRVLALAGPFKLAYDRMLRQFKLSATTGATVTIWCYIEGYWTYAQRGQPPRREREVTSGATGGG